MRQSKMYGISYMFNGKKEKFKREILIWVIALGTIMVQIVGYIVLQHLDADDSFFVAEISTILQTNYINKIDCTTGIQNYIFDQQYKLVGWEVFLSKMPHWGLTKKYKLFVTVQNLLGFNNHLLCKTEN